MLPLPVKHEKKKKLSIIESWLGISMVRYVLTDQSVKICVHVKNIMICMVSKKEMGQYQDTLV
jgi:hypothetical protein